MTVNAQSQNPSFEQLKEAYENSSYDERLKLDSIYRPMELMLKKHQVTNIGGISFGISRDVALELLKNKYGEPLYNPESTTISFNNVKYAGVDFTSVHFLFQSDGINSYLNSCIFVIGAKTRKDAIEKQKYLNQVLCNKYEMYKTETENEFDVFIGGISPLWDGHWHNLINEYLGAIAIDVIQYEQYLADICGDKYGIRIVYGPYNYVKEEF